MAAKKKAGKTDKPETVEIEVTDAISLAEALEATMDLGLDEASPKTEEMPKEAVAEATDDDGEDSEVLQPEVGETEAEAEPAADESEKDTTEEAGEEVEAADDDVSDGPPPGVQKRINKLTKRVKERDEQIADLEAKLGEAQDSEPAPAAPPRADNPYSDVVTLKDTERAEHNAEQILDWCDENEEGALITTKDGEVEYSSEEVRDARKRANKALRKWLPERKAWIAEHHQQEEYAKRHYKWWEDKSSSEFQAAQHILREFPEIQRFPDYQVTIGDTLTGMMIRLSADQKTKKPVKAKPKAPNQPMAPTAEPAPVDESAARSSSARQAFQQSGDVEDLARILAVDL